MGKIQVLDKQTAELIAAGEVVERPASVMKELVENAIDAGATAITAEIKNGGVTYMRLTDNGSGIARQDVPTAFLCHATSKIQTQEDLERIGTLGFRGEALSSIAAVAHVEITTRTESELAGTFYAVSAGEAQPCEDCGCPKGTTIVVKDIFYNVPARMKFLKKDTVEANAISGVMDRIALSHPEISFRLIRDGKEVLHTPGDGNLKSAIFAVFGKEFTAGLLPVDYTYEHIRVTGFVSRPASARPNRSMQHFFINGRYVKSKTAMVALEQAFKGSLMVGKFPSCVLHIEMAFSAVDVNVHPNKLEVRFVNEKPIFEAVYHAVKTALNQGDTPVVMNVQKTAQPSFYTQTEKPEQLQITPAKPPNEPTPKQAEKPSVSDFFIEQILKQNSAKPPLQMHDSAAFVQAEPQITYAPPAGIDITAGEEEMPLPNVRQTPVSPPQEKLPEAEQKPVKPPLRLLGEAFGTYILAQRGEDELILIDKHAAHERMLYEKLKRNAPGSEAQMLLQPVTVTLAKEEYAAVLQALETFANAGFEMEDFGAGTILVRSAPLSMEHEDAAAAVMEMAGYLRRQKTDLTTEHLDWLYHNIACRAAVKAGDKSAPQELLALVEQLEDDDSIRYCPHGRPVRIVILKKELEKQFGRIQ